MFVEIMAIMIQNIKKDSKQPLIPEMSSCNVAKMDAILIRNICICKFHICKSHIVASIVAVKKRKINWDCYDQ